MSYGRTSITTYKVGSSQRLKSDDAREKNHEKKASKAEIRYLLQYFGGQKDSSARSKRSTIPAVELAAAKVRIDKTCSHHTRLVLSQPRHLSFYCFININGADHTQSPITMTSNIPSCRTGHWTRMEYPSSRARVTLHGMTRPMTVTRKLHLT